MFIAISSAVRVVVSSYCIGEQRTSACKQDFFMVSFLLLTHILPAKQLHCRIV
jgi:hypothetical protein